MTVPKPLIDDIVDGRCLPFIGAGFSVNAALPDGRQMPTWPELTATLAQSAGVNITMTGPEIASLFEKQFGRVQLIEHIRKALFVDQSSPGQAHTVFGHLPFDTVYTTNFDTLLEDTYRLLKLPYRALVGESQMPFHGGKKMASIVKMHGDIRHEEYITITQEDYESYLNRYPVIATHLSAMLITRTPLFIGYSLTDPNFISIQEVVKSRLGNLVRMSYVVQFNASESRVNDLLEQNIHVLSLRAQTPNERSAALTSFLASMLHAVDANSAQELRLAEPELFEQIEPINIEQALAGSDPAAVLAGSSLFCIVLMPFTSTSNAVYRAAIKPAVEKLGLTSLKVDELDTGRATIMETVRTSVQQARLCIADISDGNPNVIFEVGLAITFRKPLLLIARRDSPIIADLRNNRILLYDPEELGSFEAEAGAALAALLGEDRLNEADELIREGHYQAAIVTLGSLLEQTLWNLLDPQKVPNSARLQQRRSLRSLFDALVTARMLSPRIRTELADAIRIRNQAVHGSGQPSKREAEFMLAAVRRLTMTQEMAKTAYELDHS